MIFCSPFFAEYFIKPNIFFNTYSLFYGGYQFHFNQANWDHQDEVLVPCSSGQLSIVFPIQITTKTTPFSSPLLWGGCRLIEDLYSKALVDGFPSPILRGSYRIEGVKINDLIIEVLVPLFFGVVIDQQKVTALYLCTYRSRPLFFGGVIDLRFIFAFVGVMRFSSPILRGGYRIQEESKT